MTERRVVHAEIIPGMQRPISWAVRWGDLVFVSGVMGKDFENDKWGDIRDQVRHCLQHIRKILAEAGTSLDNALSVTTHLRSREDFEAYDAEYATFFPKDPPSRTTVQCELIFPEMLVEISCIAGVPADTGTPADGPAFEKGHEG